MSKWLLAAFIAAQTADTGTSVWKISNGRFYETNPLLPSSTVGIVVTKTAVSAGSIWIAHKLAPQHPKLANFVLAAGAASGTYAAVHNATAR